MRALVQVVTSASVSVADEIVGSIDEPGLVVLVGVTHDDTVDHATRLAEKVWNLRVMDGEQSAAQAAAPPSGRESVHVVRGFDQRSTTFMVSRCSSRRQRTTRRFVLRRAPHAWRARRDRTIWYRDEGRARQRRSPYDPGRGLRRRLAPALAAVGRGENYAIDQRHPNVGIHEVQTWGRRPR